MKLRQRLEPTEIKFVVEPLQAARSRVAPTALSSSVNLICPHSAITLVEPLSTVSGSEAGSRMVGRRISFYSHLPPATISRPMRFRRDRNPRHETDSFFSPLKSFLNLAERSHVTASGFFFYDFGAWTEFYWVSSICSLLVGTVVREKGYLHHRMFMKTGQI